MLNVYPVWAGHIYSKPVEGNPVAPLPWTWKRIRAAIFGARVEVIEMDIEEVSIVELPKGAKMVRFDPAKIIAGLSCGGKITKSHMEWEKPAWMRCVASWFRPKTEGGRG